MRRTPRFTIAGLMVIILAVSLGLAALRTASATWAGGLYLLTYGVLVLAIVGAICRGPSERGWWLGFALFGLAYMKRGYWQGYGAVELPTTALLNFMRPAGVKPPGYYATDPNGGFSSTTGWSGIASGLSWPD